MFGHHAFSDSPTKYSNGETVKIELKIKTKESFIFTIMKKLSSILSIQKDS